MDVEKEWRRYRREFETYLRLERGMSGNSVLAYLHDFDHLARFAAEQGVGPCEVQADLMRQMLRLFAEAGIAPATQRRIISGWRVFFKMLVVEDVLKDI